MSARLVSRCYNYRRFGGLDCKKFTDDFQRGLSGRVVIRFAKGSFRRGKKNGNYMKFHSNLVKRCNRTLNCISFILHVSLGQNVGLQRILRDVHDVPGT